MLTPDNFVNYEITWVSNSFKTIVAYRLSGNEILFIEAFTSQLLFYKLEALTL